LPCNVLLSGNIFFPTSEASLQKLADEFKKISPAVPNVVAAVDSVVFETVAPQANAHDAHEHNANTTAIGSAFNRKGYFAVTVLAFVDAHMRILYLSMSCQSSAHDSTLFQASELGYKVISTEILFQNSSLVNLSNFTFSVISWQLDNSDVISPRWIIAGDDAFKTRGHILCPFNGHTLTPTQRNFNYFLSLLRCVVERAFALWKGKWGIFWRPLRMRANNIKLVVEVTARLHNFCIDRSCSIDPNDYCVYDDFFWTHTAPKKTGGPRRNIAPPPPFTDVVFADAETIAHVFGHNDQQRSQRWLRHEVIKFQEGQGYVAPIPTKAKLRRSGLKDAAVDSSGRMLMNSVGQVSR
jgi:hypothetical protein